MTRIVAGSVGGRPLKVPPSGTRPTTERVREAIFSRVEHLGMVAGARVLDLYAGSGALGLEAASRGAQHVTLVEAVRKNAQVITANAAALGLTETCTIVGAKTQTYVAGLDGTSANFDLVLIDPPYDVATGLLDEVLADLAAPGILDEDAVIVLERDRRAAKPTWPEKWDDEGEKTYGDTTVYFARPQLREHALDEEQDEARDKEEA